MRRSVPCLLALLPLLQTLTAVDPRPPRDTEFDARPGGFRVEPDGRNLIAGRLAGTWIPDPLVAERLGRSFSTSDYGPSGDRATFTFEPDSEVAEKIPSAYQEPLAERQLFEAGVVTIRDKGKLEGRGAYALTSLNGNMHLLFFRERDGHAFGDIESSLVSFALGKEPVDDILFLGGDFANEPFRGYGRSTK